MVFVVGFARSGRRKCYRPCREPMRERDSSSSRSSGKGRVLAILPAFNEGGSIAHLIGELNALADPPDVLVVDDGSSDDTAAVAEGAGAKVLRLPFNCGIGATVQAGILWGIEREYEILARFDGDGQHDPAALSALREPLDESSADFVLGSRYLERTGFQSTRARRLGSRWFAFLLRALTGLRITDPTSGCWVMNHRAAVVLLVDYSSDYPEVDSLVRLARSGCRVREIPISMRARAVGESSIDAVRAVYYMLKVTIALVIGRVERRS
jgi:glycosyltransferase involved in cell wall biosynthesis